jgi:hypothetical protein
MGGAFFFGRLHQTQLFRQRLYFLLSGILSLQQPTREETTMAKPNYQFKKRQKELAKKKKKEEKRQRKLENKAVEADENQKEQTPVMEG